MLEEASATSRKFSEKSAAAIKAQSHSRSLRDRIALVLHAVDVILVDRARPQARHDGEHGLAALLARAVLAGFGGLLHRGLVLLIWLLGIDRGERVVGGAR